MDIAIDNYYNSISRYAVPKTYLFYNEYVIPNYMSNAYYQSQQLIYNNNTSLIQNHYTLNVILKIKAEEEFNNIRDVPNDNNIVVRRERTRISDKVDFVICHSCFWCASCIFPPQITSKMATVTATATKDSTSLAKCPFCPEGTVESIPIAENEEYRFVHDVKRGLVMEFFR